MHECDLPNRLRTTPVFNYWSFTWQGVRIMSAGRRGGGWQCSRQQTRQRDEQRR